MSSLALAIKMATSQNRKVVVKMDAGQFERLAANFGFFSNDFLSSMDQAEKEIKSGQVRKVKSLRQLRNK